MPHRSKLFLVWILGIVAGVLAIIYGLELVSVPMVREHHELFWVVGGMILICGCAVGLFLNARRVKAKPGTAQP